MKQLYSAVIFYLFLLFVASCKNGGDNIHGQFVSDWLGKQIVFPSNSVFLVNGRDTVYKPGSNRKYKILNYVDSLGCTSCKLRLNEWKELILELDTSNVELLYYTNVRNNRIFQNAIKEDSFNYPICFDPVDSINIINRFPPLKEGVALLLDENNKVILAGSPVIYNEIRELYIRKILGEPSKEEKLKTSMAVFPTELDIGEMQIGDTISKNITVFNRGDNLLILNRILSSCGCVKALCPKAPIAPGDSCTIAIVFHSREKGFVRKSIEIIANSDVPSRILLKALVK